MVLRQLVLIIGTATTALFAAGPIVDYGFDVVADKKLYNTPTTNNIDEMYGRAQVRPHFESEKYDGALCLYFYPEGFGYSLQHVQNQDDSTQISEEPIGKTQIWEAWGLIKGYFTNFFFGRTLLYTSSASHFGNYLDEDAGGYFTGKGIFSNIIDIQSNLSTNDQLSIILGTNDTRLNTGFLRIWNQISFNKLSVGTGYKSNMFDLVRDEKSLVLHQLAINFSYKVTEKLTAYSETGFRNMGQNRGGVDIPTLLGISGAVGPLDLAALELEYYTAEDIGDRDALQYSLTLSKTFFDHFSVTSELYTSSQLEKANFALKLTGKF